MADEHTGSSRPPLDDAVGQNPVSKPPLDGKAVQLRQDTGELMGDVTAGTLNSVELTATFARIQGMLLTTDQAQHAVHQLATAARDTVPSAVGAGASMMDVTGTRRSAATTDRIAEIADQLQYDLGEGPCLTAWASATVQRIDDTTVDTRWPSWTPRARDLGLRSVLSVPLMYKDEVIGALKVYSIAADAFTLRDEQQLILLAGAAATLLGAAQRAEAPKRLSETLQATLADRRNVETATGMLMERYDIDHDAARERLLFTSRRLRRPVAQLAQQVVARSADSPL